jgi:uncharacterized protein (TIGR02246 family)
MTTTPTDDDVTAIEHLIGAWRDAAVRGDLDRIFDLYTDDLVAFDAMGPLAFSTLDDYRQHWKKCLEMCPGTMIFEIRDLRVDVHGALGCAHYLCRCGTTLADGSEQTGDMRATLILRRAPAGWRICHEHYSMPFDPTTCAV